MLTCERRKYILDILNKKQSVSVMDLVEELRTSESTIRRDLAVLHEENKLKKVHGGAVIIESEYSTEEKDVETKHAINMDKKQKIAKYAASLIEKDDFVYIDAGTTTELLADYIVESRAYYVTNGIVHAKKLANKGLNVIVIGGKLKISTEAMVGVEAVNNLNKYNFTKGFFGTNAISEVGGYSTPDIEEALVKKEALNRSKKAYILADSDKFYKTSSITFGSISQGIIITDKDKKECKINTKIIEVNQNDLYSNV